MKLPRFSSLVLLAGALPVGAEVFVSETFNYPDDNLTAASSDVWSAHSGPGSNPVQVADGQVILTSGAGSREDVNRPLGESFTGGVLFAGFDLSLSTPPDSGNAYFLHFRDAGTGFRARVYIAEPDLLVEAPVLLKGEPGVLNAGAFRLGLSNALGDNAAGLPLTPNLLANTTYRVVVAYDLDTRTSRLWVNSTDESSPTLTASDNASALTISTIALRQGGSGSPAVTYSGLALDNLFVADTFMQAVPEPGGGALALLGGGLLFLLRRRAA